LQEEESKYYNDYKRRTAEIFLKKINADWVNQSFKYKNMETLLKKKKKNLKKKKKETL